MRILVLSLIGLITLNLEAGHCPDVTRTIDEVLKSQDEILRSYEIYREGKNVKLSFKNLKKFNKDLDEFLSTPETFNHLSELEQKKVWKFLTQQFFAPMFKGRPLLTPQDLALLAKYPRLRRTYKFVTYFHEVSTHSVVHLTIPLRKYMGGAASRVAFTELSDLPFHVQFLINLKEKFYNLVNLINPIPYSEFKTIQYALSKNMPRNEGRVKNIRRIFIEQFHNPERPLSEAEIELLKSKKLYDAYQLKGKFLQEKPGLRKFKLGLSLTKSIVVLATTAFAVDYYLKMRSNQYSITEYLDRAPLAEDEIQIIVDQSPFPHLALRLGQEIFSYGVEQMTAIPYSQYLLSATFQEWLQNRGHVKDKKGDEEALKVKEKMSDEELIELSKTLVKVNPKLASAFFIKGKWRYIVELPHSANIFTLKIDPKERLYLKDYLERQRNKDYFNVTGINDCASMIVKALKKSTSINLPWSIDASPNQLGMWLNSLHSFGDPLVKKSELIMTQRPEKGKFHALRNSMIASIENKVFIKYFPIMKSIRLFYEVSRSEDEFQWYSEAELAQMDKWYDEVKKELANNVFIAIASQQIRDFERKDLLTKEEQIKYERAVNVLLDEIEILKKDAEDKINTVGLQYETIIKAEYQLELLKIQKQELEYKIKEIERKITRPSDEASSND